MTSRTLLLLGKPGCHLCEAMRDVLVPVAAEMGFAVDERNILADPELEALYRYDIPVLLLDGREVARYRATPDFLRERLSLLAPS
jgi:hypothetical protein